MEAGIDFLKILKLFTIIPLGISMYCFFSYISKVHVIKENINRLYGDLENHIAVRKRSLQEYETLYGNRLKKGWLVRVEELLKYSGILRKCRFLSTELFILGVMAIELLVFWLVLWFFSLWYIAAICVVGMYLIILGWLNYRRRQQYQKVSEEMLPFVNMIANYAGATDDIISILERTAYEIKEPLKEILIECCNRARHSGNVSMELKWLKDEVEYPFFKTIIYNLELVSRNEADYKGIVDECRELLQNNLENMKELERINEDANSQLTGTILAGVLCIYFLAKGVLRISMAELFGNLLTSAGGIAILVYTMVVVFWGLYYVVLKRGG